MSNATETSKLETIYVQNFPFFVRHHVGIIIGSHVTGNPQPFGDIHIAHQHAVAVNLQAV